VKHITYSLIEWNQHLKIAASLRTIFQTIKWENVKLESLTNGPKETEDKDLSKIGRKLLMKMVTQHTPLEREEVATPEVVVLLQMLEEVEHNNIERKKPPSDNKELKKRTSRRK